MNKILITICVFIYLESCNSSEKGQLDKISSFIADLELINNFFIHDISEFSKNINEIPVGNINGVILLDIRTANDHYSNLKDSYSKFNQAKISKQDFSQVLKSNRRYLIDTMFIQVINEWNYYAYTQVELEKVVDENSFSEDAVNVNHIQLDYEYWKLLVLYNRAFQLIERYIKENYFNPEVKFPYAVQVVRDGVLGISTIAGVMEPGVTEELVIRANGEQVPFKNGESFIPLYSYSRGDTVILKIESHNKLTGVVKYGEYYYVVEN